MDKHTMQPEELQALRDQAGVVGVHDVELGKFLDLLIPHVAHLHGLDPAEEDAKAQKAADEQAKKEARAQEKAQAESDKEADAKLQGYNRQPLVSPAHQVHQAPKSKDKGGK